MPNVTMPNGFVVYDVPDGITQQQLLERLKKAGYDTNKLLVPPQQESIIEGIPVVGGVLGQVADYPAQLVEGLAGTAKAGADVFGADNVVSGFLGDVAEGTRALRSRESRESEMARALRSKEAEEKGVGAQIGAAAQNFLESPLETTANVLGSAVPFIAAGVASGGAAVPVMLGVGVGAGTVKGAIYDATYDQFMEAGATEKQAKAAAEQAQDYSGTNLDQIALGSVLGGIASGIGFEPALARTIGKEGAKRVAANIAARQAAEAAGVEVARRGVARGIAAGVAKESIPEAFQGGQERYAANLALQRQGFDVDPWKGVAGQAAAEGISSILLGGYGGVRETRVANARATAKQYAERVEALPDQPTAEDESTMAQWALRRGFNEEEATIIGKNAVDQKRRVAQAKAEAEAALEAARMARTAGAEPSPEPDITDPGMPPSEREFAAPPVDPEEQAARERFFAEQAGRQDGLIPDMEDISPTAQIREQLGPQVGESAPAPAPTTTQPPAVLAGRDIPPIPELSGRPEEPARETPQPTEITPQRAANIMNNPVAFSDFMARFGMDEAEAVDTLSAIESGGVAGLKYSRGRRPRDTETGDMFGALPMQEAPGEEARRAELAEQRFATDEERAARDQRFAEEMEAGQERVLTMRQREEADREETLGDIEYALRAQAPENAVYKVEYNPDDANPYKLVAETRLGKKPEEVLKAKTLQEFSDKVYGQMDELTPYIPEAPPAVGEVEPMGPTEQEAPTAATRMVQDFTAEVDAARDAGQIDNNQRAQLLRRLERPNAYRTLPNGRQVPNDAIAKLEQEALEAASAERNAPADQKEAAATARKEADKRLRAAVKNSLLNPARAALKSMVETRQDEKVGARQRAEGVKVQERLGQMEGRDTKAERQEARDAKIDLKELKVQKYRRAGVKPPKGVTTKVAQRAVDAVTRSWKSTNPIEVVQSVKDIKDPKVRRAIARDGTSDAEGFVTPDGTVYLIADNLTDEARVKAVLFHEGLGHVGLAQLFRGSLDSVLTDLYNRNAKLKADTDKWRAENKDAYKGDENPLARAVEEVLAERSEKGPLERNIFQRLAAVVRDYARRIGFKLKISDADVDAMLSMAHERVIAGDTESTLLKGMRYITAIPGTVRYSRKQPKISEADAKKIEKADERLSVGARRVEKSFSTAPMLDGLEEMTFGHRFKDWVGALKDNWGLFSPSKKKLMLKAMPTSGILGWVKPNNKALYEAMREIDERVLKMNALKNRIITEVDKLAKDIRDFNDESGTEKVAALQAKARINEVDPYAFKTVEDALKGDRAIKEIESRLLKNSNNRTKTQQLIDDIKSIVMQNKDSVRIKGDQYTMSAQLLTKVKPLKNNAKDAQAVEQKVEQLAEMVRRIRDTYAARAEVDKQEGGERVYKETRQFYKDMFEAELALLDERINSIADKEEATRIKDMRAKLMREVVSPEERKKSGDLFWDLDAELFTKDYFPFMREGDRWLRVIGAKDGSREREFHTFRTDAELRAAQKKIAARLGVKPNDRSVIEIGYDLSRLQEHLRTEDALMQRVFDEVKKAKDRYDSAKNVDLKELTDAIYQTWLMTTPERSVRRRLMHAEEVVGFSPDIFLHFRKQATAYANQLSKLMYAGQVRLAVEEARAVINDKERPADEAADLNLFVDEFEDRSNDAMNPTPQGYWVNLLNRSSYYYYLTSAKTALLQLTSVPIRVVPRLWRDYGFAKGTAQWLKYMRMWDSLGKVKLEPGKDSYGDWIDAVMPNVNASSFVKNNADLQWAMKMGTDRRVLETLHDTLVQNERATPGKTASGLRKGAEDVASDVAKTMSFLFNGMENISRQATYYMTFELAIEKYRNENKPEKGESDKAYNERARNYAFRQAMDVLRNTIGDYSTWERPTIAKSNLGRAVFLFKMHPILQTKFMVGAVRDIWTNADNQRVGALKELTGVLMMAGMFGGVMGMPFYSALTYALMAAFGPDPDEDEDVIALMGGDPRTAYDPDIFFRSWVKDKFGEISIGDVPLADIFIGGPLSAALNAELASATTLDIKDLWFRDAVAGDSLEDTVVQTAVANIAGFAMVAQFLRAHDSFAEGKIEDGLKKALPAFFRTWVNAAVNETQGVRNRRGDILIPKEDINAADNFRDVLGLRRPELSRKQQYYITRARNESAIKSERKAILDKLETAVMNGEIASQSEFEAFRKKYITPFNRTFPDPEFIITDSTVVESLERRAGIRARTIDGVQLDKKTAARDFAAQQKFVK